MTTQEKALQTISENAANLILDGYRIGESNYTPGSWTVTSPMKKQTNGSRSARTYFVKPAEGTCTCEGFPHFLTCKHLQVVEMIIAENAAAARFDNGETATGCDQFAQY